jgi:DNA adenine methylase
LKWLGGKFKLTPKLLPLIPPHEVYVEPFGGAGSVLLAKVPSKIEVYNEIDGNAVNFFRVLQGPKQFKEFRRLVALTVYSRREYYAFRKAFREGMTDDPVVGAYQWYVLARQNFGGMVGHSWGFTVTESSRGMCEATSSYLASVTNLPNMVKRLQGVQIENADYSHVMARFDSPETFFYCDPPYLPSTRREGKYTFEMSEKQHQELISFLLELKGKVMLSGYRNRLYERLEKAGWKRKEFPHTLSLAGRTHQHKKIDVKRVESIWRNYALRSRSN